MDSIKKLTGKNPSEYEQAAKSLIDNSDVVSFNELVQQDDFLYDFVKNNVAKRIQNACTQENYLNLIKFLKIYSPWYENVIVSSLFKFGGNSLISNMKELYTKGSEQQKTYAAKYFSYIENNELDDLLPQIRENTSSQFEPLAERSIELLSKMGDEELKKEAIAKLSSQDEFEQYNGVKFLVTYGAKDTLPLIMDVMKKSRFSENIAAEIPYLVPIEELINSDFDNGILLLCNIVSAIPEIIPMSSVLEYNLFELFEELYCYKLTSTSALLIRMAKQKFEAITENEEYLFDCDKNTKDEVFAIKDLLSGVNLNRLNDLIYEELYDESDFVLYAVDFVEEIQELEELLTTNNQTLLLKVLSLLKEKGVLKPSHKEEALKHATDENVRNVIQAL